MSTSTHRSSERPRIVCETNASSEGDALVRSAIAFCRERNAQLIVVWTIDPVLFSSGALQTAVGTWGLLGAHSTAIERARAEGIVRRVVLRIGDPRRIIEEEKVAHGAELIFTAADVPVVRCPVCTSRYDARAVHFCPEVHLTRKRAA